MCSKSGENGSASTTNEPTDIRARSHGSLHRGQDPPARGSSAPTRILVWDLEIERPIANRNGKPDWVGARNGKYGISVVAVYDNHTGRQHLYDKNQLQAAVEHLNCADVLVGFNTIDFDTPCLQALSGEEIVASHYDILDEIWKALRTRQKGYRLGDIASRTLGLHKSGEGESAPQLVAQGRWAELHDYCMNDVHLTRELYNHIVAFGSICDINGEQLELPRPSETYA